MGAGRISAFHRCDTFLRRLPACLVTSEAKPSEAKPCGFEEAVSRRRFRGDGFSSGAGIQIRKCRVGNDLVGRDMTLLCRWSGSMWSVMQQPVSCSSTKKTGTDLHPSRLDWKGRRLSCNMCCQLESLPATLPQDSVV